MNTEFEYRAVETDLEVRSSAKGGDGRTVVGIAVPYGKPQRIDDRLVEQFARGAFNKQLNAANRVRFTREHMALGGVLIGTTRMLRDDAAGLYGEWRVSKTSAGDETLELLRDGALNHLSIGFRERQNRRLEGGIIERATAELLEVSVVLNGAYGDGAKVSGIRSAEEVRCPHCGHVSEVRTDFTRRDTATQILRGLPANLPIA